MNDQLFEQLLNALKNYRAQKQGGTTSAQYSSTTGPGPNPYPYPGAYPTDPGIASEQAAATAPLRQQAARAYKQANEPYEESTIDKIAKWGGLASLAGGLVAGAAGADSKGLAQALGLMAGGGLKYRAGAPGRDYRTRQRQLKNKLAGLAQKRAAAVAPYEARQNALGADRARWEAVSDAYNKARGHDISRQNARMRTSGGGELSLKEQLQLRLLESIANNPDQPEEKRKAAANELAFIYTTPGYGSGGRAPRDLTSNALADILGWTSGGPTGDPDDMSMAAREQRIKELEKYFGMNGLKPGTDAWEKFQRDAEGKTSIFGFDVNVPWSDEKTTMLELIKEYKRLMQGGEAESEQGEMPPATEEEIQDMLERDMIDEAKAEELRGM